MSLLTRMVLGFLCGALGASLLDAVLISQAPLISWGDIVVFSCVDLCILIFAVVVAVLTEPL